MLLSELYNAQRHTVLSPFKSFLPLQLQSTLEYSDDSRDLRRTTEINAKRQNDVDGSKLMERAPIASCMSKYCTEEASRAALPHRLIILGERTKEALAALSSLASCVLLKYVYSGQGSSPQFSITRPGRSLVSLTCADDTRNHSKG